MSRRRQLHLPPPDTRPRRVTPLAYAVALGAAAVLAACGPALDSHDFDLLAGLPTVQAEPILLASADATHPVTLHVADDPDQRQRAQFGEIVAIEPMVDSPTPNGTGAVVGGVIGAVLLGNQFGDGSVRSSATVPGDAGGAVAGNRVEKARAGNIVGYRIHVRLDHGGSRSFERSRLDGIDVGERVRVNGSRLRPA